jgi:hypothetical protein
VARAGQTSASFSFSYSYSFSSVKHLLALLLMLLAPGLHVSPAALGFLLLFTAAATVVQGWWTAYALLCALGLLLAVREHRRARRIAP